MLPLLLIPLALGALLLILGLHGRRINTHPTCRRCRYDLHALTSPTTCPECGSDLAKPRATRIGVRQCRKVAAIAGSILLALSILSIAGQITLIALGPKANAYKPVWWLLVEAEGSNDQTADFALDELHARLLRSALSPYARNHLLARALEYQADRAVSWRHGWGDVIESCRSSGFVSDEQWKQYARTAISLSLVPRSRIRSGDPLVVCAISDQRLATDSVLMFEACIVESFDDEWPFVIVIQTPEDLSPLARQQLGVTLRMENSRFWLAHQTTAGGRGQRSNETRSGHQSLAVYVNIIAYDRSSSGPNADVLLVEGEIPPTASQWNTLYETVIAHELHPPTKAIRCWNEKHILTVEVLPETTPSVAFATDPNDAAAISRSLKTARLTQNRTLDQVNSREIRCSIQLPKSTSTPLFATLFARDLSGTEKKLMDIVPRSLIPLNEGSTRQLDFTVVVHNDFGATNPIALVLRPRPDLAARTVDTTEIFGEEIIIENVPIHRPTP